MRRQTAKDDRARRRRTCGTPSRAQGVRQRAGGVDRAAGAGCQKGCLFCCDKRSPGYVGRARRSLVRRTYRTPPHSLLRLPASPRVSLVSRRNPSGDRPPAAALECQDICETVHSTPFAPWRRYTPPSALSCSVPRCPWERGRGRLSLSPRSLPGR